MSQTAYTPVDALPEWVDARVCALAATLYLPAPTRSGFLFVPDAAFYEACTTSIITLQGAARRVIDHLGLRCDTVVVAFRPGLNSAAHIERDAGAWYIEIDARWQADGRSLGAILAHEICHILVEERRLPRFGIVVDEVHVDLAVMLSGLGALTLNGNRTTADANTTVRYAFGYLSPALLRHAYARVAGSLHAAATAPLLDWETRAALLAPLLAARLAPPLVYGAPGEPTVPCGGCARRLRVPSAKKGTARCPACRREQSVDTRPLRTTQAPPSPMGDAPLPRTEGWAGLRLRAHRAWHALPTEGVVMLAAGLLLLGVSIFG